MIEGGLDDGWVSGDLEGHWRRDCKDWDSLARRPFWTRINISSKNRFVRNWLDE